MKKLVVVICLVMFFAINVGPAIGGDYGRDGPAPNSGDGIPDGSGFDNPSDPPGDSNGPAPNSGDGIPDGSGF